MSEGGGERDARPETEPAGAPEGDPAEAGVRRFRLAGGGALQLEPEGFRLVPSRGFTRSPRHDYAALGHVFADERMLLLGLESGLLQVPASDFAEPGEGPTVAAAAIREAIAARPDGVERLRALDDVEALGERDGPAWLVWGAIALCLLGTAMQLGDPLFEQTGVLLPELFVRGEYWRAITMHFLHDLIPMPGFVRAVAPFLTVLPLHLIINVAGLVVLGQLVERPLGPWRTAIVLAMAGVGAVLGIFAFGHTKVMGASGLVAGLAGAMLAMELHFPKAMPAFWRVPRRAFIILLVVQFGMIDPLFSHYLAGGAHLGGFAGGYLAAWQLGAPSVRTLAPVPSIRIGAYSAVALALVGFLGALPLARHEMPALERHALRLYDIPDAAYLFPYDNAAAWLIATEGESSPEGLDLAIALAERAVINTGGRRPGIVDTLAEALFQRGNRAEAIVTIDEAIRLAPFEPYFQEQRRRFTGERDPADRPPPPGAVAPDRLPPGVEPPPPAFEVPPERVSV